MLKILEYYFKNLIINEFLKVFFDFYQSYESFFNLVKMNHYMAKVLFLVKNYLSLFYLSKFSLKFLYNRVIKKNKSLII